MCERAQNMPENITRSLAFDGCGSVSNLQRVHTKRPNLKHDTWLSLDSHPSEGTLVLHIT